jgi:predicted nucleotidyltransferase
LRPAKGTEIAGIEVDPNKRMIYNKNMNNQAKIQIIKQIIEGVMKASKISLHDILLFGSRARETADDLSDYDLLIITENKIANSDKMEIAAELRKRLASPDADIDADIILKSIDEIETAKELIGGIVREALKEGIRI